MSKGQGVSKMTKKQAMTAYSILRKRVDEKETVEQQVQAIVKKLIVQWEAKGFSRTSFEETNLAVHAASS